MNIISSARQFILFFLLTAFVFLSGCGGGGGGGPEPTEPTEPKLIQATFDANSFPQFEAEVTRQNSFSLLYAFHQVTESILHPLASVLREALFSVPSPAPFPSEIEIFRYSSALKDFVGCHSGDVSYHGELSILQDSETTVVASNCGTRFGGEVSGGEVKVKSEGSLETRNNFRLEFDVIELSVVHRGVSFTVSGSGNFTLQEGVVFENVIVEHRDLGISFGTDDLRIEPDTGNPNAYLALKGNVSGTVYHSEHGYFTVGYNSTTEELLLTGAKDSQLLASIDIDSRNSDFFTYDYALELKEPIVSEFPLVTKLPIEHLPRWHTSEQSEPVPELVFPTDIDRLADVILSANATVDPDFDFLSFQWRDVSVPEGCSQSITPASLKDIIYSAECQGSHTVSLAVFDGFSTVDDEFTFEVRPLMAMIEDMELVSHIDGESLSIQIDIENLLEDGPFGFSLAFAPNGVSVNADGLITGVPQFFISNDEHDFSLAVDVDNGRTVTTIAEVNVQAEKEPMSFYPVATVCGDSWSNIDNSGGVDAICTIGNSYLLTEVNDSSFEIKFVEHNPPSHRKLVTRTRQDINNDGVEEIILGYEDKIAVIDGQTKNVIASVDVTWNEEYKIIPVIGGYDKLFIYSDAQSFVTNRAYLLDTTEPHDLNEYALGNDGPRSDRSPVIAVNNVDQDPEPEFFVGFFQYDFVDGRSQLAKRADFVGDWDGNDVIDFITIESSEPLLENSDSVILSAFEPITGTVIESHTINLPSSNFRDIFFVNVDDDKDLEILIASPSIQHTLIYKRENGALNLVKEESEYVDAYPVRPASNAILSLSQKKLQRYSLDDGLQSLAYRDFNFYHSLGPFKKNNDETLLIGYQPSMYESIGVSSPDIVAIRLDKLGNTLDQTVYDDISVYFYDAQLMGTPTNFLNGATDEFLFYDRFDGTHQVFDLNDQSVLFQNNINFQLGEIFNSGYITGNIDGDGVDDVIAYNYSGFSWIDIVLNKELWNLDGLTSQLGLFVDSDNDGLDEFYAVSNDRSSQSIIYRYEFENDEFIETKKIEERFNFPSIYLRILSNQDVDGDGVQEIIAVYQNNSGCVSLEHNFSRVIVMDADLNVKSEFELPLCINTIPSIKGSTPKNNLLVSYVSLIDPTPDDVYQENVHVNDQHSYFVEIDVYTGTIVWQSHMFLGKFKQGGFKFFGDDPYVSRKVAMCSIAEEFTSYGFRTGAAVYFFQ